MSENNSTNSSAVAHLIRIERSMSGSKGTTSYHNVIKALGEAGGATAVAHLISIERSISGSKGTAVYQAVVSALGRAGRIS